MCCLNEEWRLMRLNFQENFTFGRRTSKFAKENPQNCPPLKRKEKKKNPKHLKCSLTRAKDESHKRVDSSSLFLSLSLCPPLDNHEIYHKISLNFNIQQSWTLTKLKLKIKKKKRIFFIFFFITTAYTWEAACCTCESCGLTLKIASSIGELLLLIYKSGFYRWEQNQPSKDNHD